MTVTVVGGGAAGMLAAISAAMNGNSVELIEQNEKLGKKIYITGKGRCNVTNAAPLDELFKNIVRNPRFMYSALNTFGNDDICSLLENAGCALKTERGNRVFPVSDHASDVIFALTRKLKDLGVKVRLQTKVKSLIIEKYPEEDCTSETIAINKQSDGASAADSKYSEKPKKKIHSVARCLGVMLDNGTKIFSDVTILATGGVSYPSTGSDGYILNSLPGMTGHSIAELRPALVPFITDDEWIPTLEGLSLKNVSLYMTDGKKIRFSEQGEMLFTGKGISGPLVLSASSYYEPGYSVYLDLKPALSEEKLNERLLRDFKDYSNRDFDNALDDLFPKRLIPVMIRLSGIDAHKKVHQITGQEREEFICLIKHLPINVNGTAGFNEAVITRGGVTVKEIDPSTMKSKLIDGLSFAGEMMDVDALTGGFNLQIAWSTGYLAGTMV